ncbi:protocatechuate-dioxygenase subunit beta [Massarina eburnea CBS 473.64]|uniref:Protocatechuate-dioxygenase subunit beta n=1 Tax=Massarina eburnea CBS 473.64 TaxID=1395130 RepID=A0A6A6S3Q0_9PLEO|nr:protocatechuate-dioxygenase subunit beta [Massarina eburnea CBS 473.64]
MGKIVAGIALSHAPGALGFPETAPPHQRQSTEKATRDLGITLEEAKPDVIFAFLDDHFENFFRMHMPSIAIGVADYHEGPADQWMEPLRIAKKTKFPGAPKAAEYLIRSLVDQGFDCSRTGPIEYGQNLLMPWTLMKADLPNVAVVPIFLNVFTPPLMRYSRAYALGEACRKAALSLPEETRIAFMCTGGLSHWPPYWNPNQAGNPPADPFLALMKEYQTYGKPVLQKHPTLMKQLEDYEIDMAAKNEYPMGTFLKVPLVSKEWDMKFLDNYCAANTEWLRSLSYEDVEAEAGHGGHEVLNWVALSGAMGGNKSRLLLYEPITEWICGMSYVDFEVGKRHVDEGTNRVNGANGVH